MGNETSCDGNRETNEISRRTFIGIVAPIAFPPFLLPQRAFSSILNPDQTVPGPSPERQETSSTTYQTLNLVAPTEAESEYMLSFFQKDENGQPMIPVVNGMYYLPMEGRIEPNDSSLISDLFPSPSSSLSNVFSLQTLPTIEKLMGGNDKQSPNLAIGYDLLIQEGLITGISPRITFNEDYLYTDFEGNQLLFPIGSIIYFDQRIDFEQLAGLQGAHFGSLFSPEGEFTAVYFRNNQASQAYADELSTIQNPDGQTMNRPQNGSAIMAERIKGQNSTVQLFTEDAALNLVYVNATGTRIRRYPGTSFDVVGNIATNLVVSPRDKVIQGTIIDSLDNLDITELNFSQENPPPSDAYGYALSYDGHIWTAVYYRDNNGMAEIGWTARDIAKVYAGPAVPEIAVAGENSQRFESVQFDNEGRLEGAVLRQLAIIQVANSNMTFYASEDYFESKGIEFKGFDTNLTQELEDFVTQENLSNLRGKNIRILLVGGVARRIVNGMPIEPMRISRRLGANQPFTSVGVGTEITETGINVRAYAAPLDMQVSNPSPRSEYSFISVAIIDSLIGTNFTLTTNDYFKPDKLIIYGGNHWWKTILAFVNRFPGGSFFISMRPV